MTSPALKKVLITGAGTGFGHEAAMRLAEKDFDVIAGVEIYAQVQTLKRQAADRGVRLRVEKLDVTNGGDRRCCSPSRSPSRWSSAAPGGSSGSRPARG
jgi:NAD(P)-dependent dehydrogenase (short-subunit alcohol dehydrogenase family)